MTPAQVQLLADLAKSKKLFLMEAHWSRFFPLYQKVNRVVHKKKKIGPVNESCCKNAPFPADNEISPAFEHCDDDGEAVKGQAHDTGNSGRRDRICLRLQLYPAGAHDLRHRETKEGGSTSDLECSLD